MPKPQSSDSEMSSSEHSPPPPDAKSKPKISQEADSIDPEQDALVGRMSLDDRFNEEQLKRLVLKKDEYRCAGKKARKELALRMGETFATEMLKSGVKVSESERAAVLENVKTWFAQRARSRKEPIEWTVHWSGRQVFYKSEKDRVKRTQKRMYEAHTGKLVDDDDLDLEDLDVLDVSELPKDRVLKPFDFFQRALSTEWDALTPKQRDAYEEKARVWRTLGPDNEERRFMAEKHLPRTVRSFTHNAYRQMGARLFILASWEDLDGRIITVPFDFNHELGSDGRSFKIDHRSYLDRVGLLERYSAFSQKIWPDQDTPVDRDASPMDITFATSEDGRAILPDPNASHSVLKPFRYLPNLIRKFLDADYALARGIPVGEKSAHSVPWKHLQNRLFEFVDPIYFPEGWTGLKDPGGLGVNACRALLNHWWKRQQAGNIPFEFHHWEASPPVYDEDGVTVRVPAKMEPREDLATLPWSSGFGKSGPKARPPRRNRRRKVKSTRNTDAADHALSPSPEAASKDSQTGKKASKSGTSQTGLDSHTSKEVRTAAQQPDPTSTSESEESHSESESDGMLGSARGRPRRSSPQSPGLVSATNELSLGSPATTKPPKAKKSRKPRTQEKAKAKARSRSRSTQSRGKGNKKGKKVQWDDLPEDFETDGEQALLDDGQDETQGDDGGGGEGQGAIFPSSKGRGVLDVDGSHGESSFKGSRAKPKKQSAEDRDLLAVANSSQFKLESPKRKSAPNKRYAL